jgi:putative FmdB family regulatory protein
MPTYEYRCNQCGKEFPRLFLNARELAEVTCEYCGSDRVARVLSSFRVHQSEESRIAGVDTSKPSSESYSRDPRNIGLWAKKRMREMGVDLGPKMDEIVEKGRTGKILED